MCNLSHEDLTIRVTKFTLKYNNDASTDLLRQIVAFKTCAENLIRTAENPNDILNTLMKLELANCFPDLVTAYCILLALPVNDATNERSLSKLKLIKSYL